MHFYGSSCIFKAYIIGFVAVFKTSCFDTGIASGILPSGQIGICVCPEEGCQTCALALTQKNNIKIKRSI
jgi:hypothetical protein